MRKVFIILLLLIGSLGAWAKVRQKAHKRPAPARHARHVSTAKRTKSSTRKHVAHHPVKKRTHNLAPIPKVDTTVAISADKINNLLGVLANELGKPYRPGANGPTGFDCSGFIKFGFFIMGLALPHTADGLSHLGRVISLTDVRPGDLLFFTGSRKQSKSIGHVGCVYKIDSGKVYMIHSSREGVNILDINSSDYYKSRLRCARRLFKADSAAINNSKG